MTTQLTETDRTHLARALELAEGGRGRVSPNPLVGAVIVRDGAVIGKGFHAELGGPHAERAALTDCQARGEDPAGATMYVTLEPCAHQGRQPPCVEAILAAGIARVVIASDDPSEKASGRGPGILRDGGVEVAFAQGAEATAARLLNQPFRKHARTGIPFITLKLAMSLDGQTRTAPGDSPWISGDSARALVHTWRAEHDAIACGIGTALADDPLLTSRALGDPRQPIRVIFDSQARLPLASKLLATLDQSPVLVVTSPEADPNRLQALRSSGAEILATNGATSADRVQAALSDLGRRNITSLFLEGGPTLATSFAAADQLDESRTFIAPVLLGTPDQQRQQDPAPRAGGTPVGASHGAQDAQHPSTMGETGVTGPARRAALSSRIDKVGDDYLISARYKEW